MVLQTGAVAGRPLVFSGHACRSATNFWKKERRTLRKEKQGSNVTRTHDPLHKKKVNPLTKK